VSERPEPVAALDLLFEAARIAHEASFELHRRLVSLEADDDHTRSRLHESARLALDELPAVTARRVGSPIGGTRNRFSTPTQRTSAFKTCAPSSIALGPI
jgi:hypothetical protein